MADTILKNSTFQYQEKDGTPVSIEVRLIEKLLCLQTKIPSSR